jgi:uncharacterized protein
MGRLIVLVLLVVLAVWLVRRALRAAKPQQKSAVQGELVACARCGVHLPRAEARESGGRVYCGEEHARLGPDQGMHSG